MYCIKCGRYIDDNSKFCSYCGSPANFAKPVDPFDDFSTDKQDSQPPAQDEPVQNDYNQPQNNQPQNSYNQPQNNQPQNGYCQPPFPGGYYQPPVQNVNGVPDDKKFNAFSLSGFILGLIGLLLCVDGLTDVTSAGLVYGMFSIAGLTLSIVGFIKSKEYNSGKIFGIVGMVISGIAVILWMIMLVLVIITPYLIAR